MYNLSIVPYEQGRSLVENGDIVFIANKRGILPQLIRFVTRSNFSHAAIAFWVDTAAGKRLMTVQTQTNNKRFVMNLNAMDNCDLYIITSPTPWEEVAPLALSKLDKVPYSYMEALSVGLHEFLVKYFNVVIKQHNHNFSGEICSEFIARVLNLDNVHVSPQGLYEQLIKTQQFRVVLKN